MTVLRRCGALAGWCVVQTVVAAAQVCDVPASRPTIQSAVDDPGCTEIVLAISTFEEDVSIERSVALRSAAGGTATITGTVAVSGTGTVATLEQLEIDPSAAACSAAPTALEAIGEAELVVRSVVTRSADVGVCPLFADGFEQGDVSGWS